MRKLGLSGVYYLKSKQFLNSWTKYLSTLLLNQHNKKQTKINTTPPPHQKKITKTKTKQKNQTNKTTKIP